MEYYGVMNYGISVNPNGCSTISQHMQRQIFPQNWEEIVRQFIAIETDSKELYPRLCIRISVTGNKQGVETAMSLLRHTFTT